MTIRYEPNAGPQLLTGKLLVASPTLTDPNFERSVVLIVTHDDHGALGVVLNRATATSAADLFVGLDQVFTAPSVVFQGGPVQPEAAICLARVRPGIEPPGFTRLNGNLGTFDPTTDSEILLEQIDGIRLFAGYAGWSADQLEAEIADGSWFVFDALPGDAFAARPDDLWSVVLRRQGGMLAAVAFFPDDPTWN